MNPNAESFKYFIKIEHLCSALYSHNLWCITLHRTQKAPVIVKGYEYKEKYAMHLDIDIDIDSELYLASWRTASVTFVLLLALVSTKNASILYKKKQIVSHIKVSQTIGYTRYRELRKT